METTPALPPNEIKKLKRDHINRLMNLADEMVGYAEKLKRPTEPADVEKHAKTLLAVTKTVEQIHALADRAEASCGDMEMNDDTHDRDETQPDTLEQWRGYFERKLNRLADSAAEAGVAGQPDAGGLQTPP